MLTSLYVQLTIICGLIIPINSGLRSFSHNSRVGGVAWSKHLTGEAFDLGLHFMSMSDRQCVITTSRKLFKKTIVYPNHVHVE